MKKRFYSIILLASIGSAAWAQTDSQNSANLMDMSLEDLMNVKVVSASKKSENLFDAPLSASVLTRDEIQKAGATSIMEALRLMPGLIVRQSTNGNYDIHIRGLDNVPPNSLQVYSANTTTLVMIDNRPVYNYLQGGTFWESLPIDLNDVEKIEVVRGASATLYGPNAVSGVINIITRKTDKKGWNTTANAQYGSLRTAVANASVGYQFNDKLSAIVSANYQGRGREVSYYHPVKDQYYNTPDSLTYYEASSQAPQKYPHPDRAMNKYGANLFLNFNPNEKVQLSLSSGLQNSEVQNAYSALIFSSLSTSTSRTGYADLKANVYGFSGQLSYLKGKQNPNLGFTGSAYDFQTLDATLEYEIKVLSNLSMKPGANYRRAVYDDTPYADASKREGFFNKKTQLDTYAYSLRVDYQAIQDKLRFVGGARIDKFTHPDKGFLSFQLAGNYKPHASHLVRMSYSRAFRSAFIYDTYIDLINYSPLTSPGLPPGSYTETTVVGNKNLNMLQSDMLEVGYRVKMADNLSLDLETYYAQTKNYTNIITGQSTVIPGNPFVVKTNIKVENLPMSAHQLGATISANYVLNRLQLKPFVTVQQTTLKDYSPYSTLPESAPQETNGYNPQQNNVHSGMGTRINHQFTPALYGGAFINYQLGQKFNLNLNPYYTSGQTFYHSDNIRYNDGSRGVSHFDPKLIVNANLSYSPTKPISVFVNVKNLLNNTAREYYKTDQIGAMFLVGASLKY
jgi:iron complex outermembrane recepter protein